MTRWWDPGSDVALLTPVADPRAGMGNALTALHRAGAAAIYDAVSTCPVVDDQVLVHAMAAARAQFAPLLIEPVAKAVGDDRYAGLLLRDVFDDAELTGLQLFRTAVAKGVPTRMAAERVAKIYGVGRADLGRYGRLATDPRAPVPVVNDVADETLFTAIAKLVNDEATPGTISKAESRDTRRAAQVEEPRDAGGKYTIAGQSVEDWLTAQAAAAEADQQQEQVAGPTTPTRIPLKRTRKLRRLRRVPPAAPAATRERAGRERAGRPRRGRQLSERARKLRDLAAETNPTSTDLVPYDVTTLPAAAKAGRRRDVPDHLEVHTPPDGMTDLKDDVAFALPYSEAVAFLRDAPEIAGEDGSFKVARAGALAEYAGDPNRLHPSADNRHVAHDYAVSGIAQMMQSSPTFAGQTEAATYRLSPKDEEILAGGGEGARRHLEDLKADLVRDWADVHDKRISVAREVGYVEMVPTYADEEQMILVYTPPPEAGDENKRRVINIAEFYIPTGGMKGLHERGTDSDPHETFVIDPNQPLLFKNPRDANGMRLPYPVFWDEDEGVMRTVIYVRGGDEIDVKNAENRRFGKAMSREEFADAVDAGEIHRDHSTGEFTSTEDYLRSLGFTIASDQTAPAASRQLRRTRKLRRLPAKPVPATERQRAMRQLAQRDRQLREHTVRAREAIAVRTPEREFLPFDDYTLTSDTEMLRRLKVNPVDPEAAGSDHIVLDRSGVEWLVNKGALHRDDAEANLMNRGAEAWMEQQVDHAPKLLEPMKLRKADDWHALEVRLRELSFDDGVEAIALQFHPSVENGDPVVQVRFLANAKKLPVQNAIRWESGGPDDRNLELVYEGETRGMSRDTLATMVRQLEAYDRDSAGRWDLEDYVINPRVRLWRVQRRTEHPGT